mgnify:CR=1 FL=1
MKKRMFLTTALMALVLLVAVTTATFAWYQAAEGGKTAIVETQDITTSSTEFKAGAVTVKFTLSNPTTNVGPTDQAGNIKYKTQNGALVTAPSDTYTKEGTVQWTVTVEKTDANMTIEEAYALLKGEYVVQVSGSSMRFDESNAIGAADTDTVSVSFKITEAGIVLGTNTAASSINGQIKFAVNSSYETKGGTLTIGGTFTTKPTDVSAS